MREVPTSEAKANFSRLLDEIERGETIAITRYGRRIARLVPEQQYQQKQVDDAIANMKALAKEIREQGGGMTIDEILTLRHEGHKY
jgi:prevent-host-death family protein